MSGRREKALLALLSSLAAGLGGCSCNDANPEIGPAGGSVATSEGEPRVSLWIPEHAVASPQPFVLRPVMARLAGAVGPAIEAGPHGTIFKRPVALRFAPTKAELAPGISFGELRVATLSNGKWEFLPTSFPSPGVVEGLTSHFSTFSLLAPCHVSGTGTDFPLVGCPTFDACVKSPAGCR